MIAHYFLTLHDKNIMTKISYLRAKKQRYQTTSKTVFPIFCRMSHFVKYRHNIIALFRSQLQDFLRKRDKRRPDQG